MSAARQLQSAHDHLHQLDVFNTMMNHLLASSACLLRYEPQIKCKCTTCELTCELVTLLKRTQCSVVDLSRCGAILPTSTSYLTGAGLEGLFDS